MWTNIILNISSYIAIIWFTDLQKNNLSKRNGHLYVYVHNIMNASLAFITGVNFSSPRFPLDSIFHVLFADASSASLFISFSITSKYIFGFPLFHFFMTSFSFTNRIASISWLLKIYPSTRSIPSNFDAIIDALLYYFSRKKVYYFIYSIVVLISTTLICYSIL